MKGMQQNRVKNAMCVVLSNKELQYDKKTKTNLCPHQSISFQKNNQTHLQISSSVDW